MKTGRNQPCPCGSGQKYKHCHGAINSQPTPSISDMKHLVEVHSARERVRQVQQGLGRPILAFEDHGHRVVAVGNTLHWSPKWKTFVDFLGYYIKVKLGDDWRNAEIAKPLNERHPILQWYDAVCHQQAETITPGEIGSSTVTGAIACYYGVAYGLYMLEHNVELQERMVKRLKDPGNFQGAYFELLIARALIHAGFKLTLEDETDPSKKHCEFAAHSLATGRKYWIEAKMRGVVGLLGRTSADGTPSPNPISHMIKHLNGALKKPADDMRMIFIDVNAEMPLGVSATNQPSFVDLATKKLEQYEQKTLPDGEAAYIFVSNLNFHRNLHDPAQLADFPFGLGMSDFNRTGSLRLSERHRQEQKHLDAVNVAEGLSKLLTFPATFDGSLPAVGLQGERSPKVIGESYVFEGVGENSHNIKGIVANATVMEDEKFVLLAVNSDDGNVYILKEPMTDAQLADYRVHPDAYFGRIVRPPAQIKSAYELFKFFWDAHREASRSDLLARMTGWMGVSDDMEDDDLLALFCEGLVSASGMFKSHH